MQLDEHGIVERADITQDEADGGNDLVVALDIVFRTGSYGQVDEAMLRLEEHISSTLEAGPGCPGVDYRETQLVPAQRCDVL